jgi:hypothetical protein
MSGPDRKVARLETRRWEKAARKWLRLKEREDPGCIAAYFEYERLMSGVDRAIMDSFWRITAETFQQSPENLEKLSLEYKAGLGMIKEMTIDGIVMSLKKLYAIGAITIVTDENHERMRIAPSYPDGTIAESKYDMPWVKAW